MLAKKGKRVITLVLALALVLTLLGLRSGGQMAASASPQPDLASPLGSAFTYQGSLSDASGPVNGTCDFTFRLYDDAGAGTLLGTLPRTGVDVMEGRFAVKLDFGAAAFDGNARWLEIDLDCGGGTVTLTPRLELTSAPYALFAKDSDTVDGLDAGAFVRQDGAMLSYDLTFSGWSSVYDWQVGWESATVPPDPDLSWFYVKDLDDTAQPLRLLIWEETGDVVIAKNLGIGTDSPQSRLHVQGDSAFMGDHTGVYAEGPTYGIEGVSDGKGILARHLGTGNYVELGTGSYGVHAVAWSGTGGLLQAPNGDGVRGESSASNKSGVYGTNSDSGGYGVYGGNSATGNAGYLGGAYGVYGMSTSEGAYAAAFRGNVGILSRTTGTPILELGEGLDYAEGFDVSSEEQVYPGTVLIIDSEQPGELTVAHEPYDRKVAGIVAGARGLGSGVRLGADQYDYDVALAGRVYCYVDATETAVEPGDLLTTSGTPGYAMKVTDYDRAQGAILGKAMEGLDKGEKGLILVLVTLQ